MSTPSKSFYELVERTWALEKQGKKIIRLNVGNTALNVPDEALAALRAVKKGPSGYGPAAGMYELRDEIAKREECSTDEIVIGSGSKFLIYAILNALKRKGGHLLLPAPYWPAYPLIAEQLGLPIKVLETSLEGGWEIRDVDFAGAAGMLLCNPLNPTSTCYRDETLERIAAAAKLSGVPLILDEAYRDLAFRPLPTVPGIRIRSFSKEFNMEGFRLGYVVADRAMARELTKFIQISTTCVPMIIQEAGLAALKERAKITERNREVWLDRLLLLSQELKLAGFEFAPPESGMYIFARHPDITDSVKYAYDVLEKGVAISPGDSFGPYKNFIRISASAEKDVLRHAARILGEACG